MATFIINLKFTQQGTKDLGQTTKRAAAFKAAAEKMGAKVREIYWTLGNYDGVLVLEAADDETAAALLVQLGTLGNVQTTTLRAFNTEEMEKILSKAHLS